MYVEWDKSLEIGVPHIDEQHESLFNLLNILVESIHNKVSDDTLKEVVEELTAYCTMHFQSERTYMQIKGYPERYSHDLEHKGFQREVLKFHIRILEGETGFAKELAEFIRTWMVTHIKTVDVKLKEI